MKMKKKHLLTAMVLPALFAACTNEDFESASQGTQNIEGRKMIENVTLNLESNAETRLAYGSAGYQWEADDAIGACLMDVITNDYQNPTKLWNEWFDLTDYIQTNYMFVRDEDGNWNTEAKMCEGNYFFCYPYNTNYGLRDAYSFTAAVQTLEGTDNASLMKAYTENNAFIGYGKVKAGDSEGESVKVDMVPVFGATGFTIKNTGTNTYTIERIVLRGTEIKNAAVVNPTSCTDVIQYNGMPAINNKFNVAQYVGDVDEVYNSSSNPNGKYNPSWGAYSRVNALLDVLDYSKAGNGSVEVFIEGGNTVAPQKSINVIAMVQPVKNIPAVTLPNANTDMIVLDIYTDKGIISNIQLNNRYTTNEGGSSTSNVLTDVALSEIGTGNKVEVTFDDTSLDVPAEMDVNSNEDLATLIHWNAKVPTAIKANLTADVTITKEMYAELAASTITGATINGKQETAPSMYEYYSVTIAGDVADGALDAFTFTDVETVYVKGTQSMKKAQTSPIEVSGGATLNIAKDVQLGNNLTNYGTLNVNAKLDGTHNVNNYGSLNVAAGKKVTSNVTLTNGMQNVAGTIVNAGTIENLTNTQGTVTNNGVIGIVAAAGSITTCTNGANGTIINNGKAYIDTNSGKIYAEGTSTTRVNDNSNANIIITNLDEDNGNFLTGSGKLGNIVQEISEDANTDAIDMRANTIWLSASLKVEKKDNDGNYVDVNLLDATGLKNGAIKVIATSANARIDGNDKKLRIEEIIVNAASKLVLNKVMVVVNGTNKVTMNGKTNQPATLTINSNASIQVAGNALGTAITVQGGASNNVLDNNSSSTSISFQ